MNGTPFSTPTRQKELDMPTDKERREVAALLRKEGNEWAKDCPGVVSCEASDCYEFILYIAEAADINLDEPPKALFDRLAELIDRPNEYKCPYCGHIYKVDDVDDIFGPEEYCKECKQCHKEFKVIVKCRPVRSTVKLEETDIGKDCPEDPAWAPVCQAASEFEEAMYVLENRADAAAAQEAANEAMEILKAYKPQIEQLHTLLEQEGSEDDR